MADVLSGSAWIPSPLTRCPKNFNSDLSNSHFSGFSVAPAASNALKYCGESLVVLGLIFAENEDVVYLAENSL